MRTNFGRVTLRLHLVEYTDTYCNGKLVFADIEGLLEGAGLRLRSVESREHGRGSFPALRVRTSARKPQRFDAETELSIIERKSGNYTHKILFDGLELELARKGVHVDLVSTREDKQRSTLAMRVKLEK
jgi:hypothetical protein